MFEDKDEREEMNAEGTQETNEQNAQAVRTAEAQDVGKAQTAETQGAQGAGKAQIAETQGAQGAADADTTYRINFRDRTEGADQQTQAQQTQQQYRQEQQAQQTQQQYQQTQQQYQQTQYSYTPRNGQAGGAGGGTGNGGTGSRRADRAARNPRRRRPYLAAIGCSVICGVIVAVCILGSSVAGRNMIRSAKEEAVEITTNEDKLADAAEIETAIADEENVVEAETVATTGDYTVSQIAEQCGSSVVAITNRSVQEVLTMFGTFEQESEGSGSGVIVGQDDNELLIVTNYHVVEDADDLTVCFFDSEDAVYSALVKGTDPNNDLAVVSIPISDIDTEVLNRISIATIGNSDSMKVGDGVVAIGNALGLGQSVTSGIISAVDREVTIDDYTARLIQTDAAINPGNSGGALFNMKGELIGINSAKYASEEIEGMGFAIPTSIAQPIIETLMSQQTRVKLEDNYGCLNITGSDVTTDAYQAYGMPTGVYVNSVLEGGAAANAGIQTGDIITAMDGISLTGIEMLRDRLQYFEAGETVEFTVARNSGSGYEEFDVEVTLDNASEQDASAFSSGEEEEEYNEDDYYGYYGYGDDGSSYGYGDGGYYGYGDGGYYGYGDGDYYGYGDGYYSYGDIEDFFDEYGSGSYY